MNYIGSKLSLIDFLTQKILEFGWGFGGKEPVFADLFAGTGVVGKVFKEKGFKVISNDIQHYSYVINKHNIENSSSAKSDVFYYLNNLQGEAGFIFNNYCLGSGSGRNYFTDENGKKCDKIRIEIENLKNKKEVTLKEYYHLLSSLIVSIDKFANTTSVYGAFLKHIKKSAQMPFFLKPLPVISGNDNGEVFNKDIKELIKNVEGDILYLDPPYNSRQYCSNYHVLETISKYDDPLLFGKTGLRDSKDQKSKFCSKRDVLKEFEEIIKGSKFDFIFLSYNNEGLMTLDEIERVMTKYGLYQVFKKGNKRYRADGEGKRNHKSKETIEYLHCLKKY